ncbi:MAG: hypothetical protein U0836_21000 [Pirellulales bacterium]
MAIRRPRKPEPLRYELVKGEPQLQPDVAAWKAWQTAAGDTLILQESDYRGMHVSTTFTGVDDVPRLKPGPPKLYKTTVSGGRGNGLVLASASAAEARQAHGRMLAVLRKYYSDDSPTK